eukprot:34575-Amorphochlora_amoeboformis.AAC.1
MRKYGRRRATDEWEQVLRPTSSIHTFQALEAQTECRIFNGPTAIPTTSRAILPEHVVSEYRLNIKITT